MNKRYLLIILCAFVFLIILCIAIAGSNAVVAAGCFNLEEYPIYVDAMPENTERGVIPDEETAAREANEIWKEVYGKEFKGRIIVKHDEENACWLIAGEISLFSLGDFLFLPNAIITEEGIVLSIWLSQV